MILFQGMGHLLYEGSVNHVMRIFSKLCPSMVHWEGVLVAVSSHDITTMFAIASDIAENDS